MDLLLTTSEKLVYTALFSVNHPVNKIQTTKSKTIYLEDNNHKPVDFNGETMSFFCQLIKIY